MKKSTKDSIVVGFALFSMFFGAGNLIFPAFLGNKIGSEFILGIIGFICTGVGLPLLAILACSKGDGTFKTLSSKIGVKFSVIFTAILFIAIGPMLAIPRTAATTFELTINPFFPSISPFIAMAVYFIINLFFVLSSTSIIDAIGKYLTPALMILLVFLIVKGFISPIGSIVETNSINVFSSSLLEGYQTMDAIAALLFAGIITTSLRDKGYNSKEMPSMILKSSTVAVIGLAFIYGGLTYIGAQTANFFEKISNGKLPFKVNAIVLSIVSLGLATLGVDNIVVLSVPILNVLYPVSITLIATTLLSKVLKNLNAIKLGVYTSLVFGILFAIPGINLSFIPLASIGFGWVIPTIISIIVGYIIFNPKNSKVPQLD